MSLRSFARRIPPMRIATFIGILHLLIGILGAGIISAFSLYFIYRSGQEANLREVENVAFVVVNALEEPVRALQSGSGSAVEIETTLISYFKNSPEIQFTLLAPDGTALLKNSQVCSLQGVSADSPEVQKAIRSYIGHSIRKCDRGERVMLVAARIGSNEENLGILVLASPYDKVMAPTYRTMGWMGVVALLIVAFTLAEGLMGSLYISQPVVRLSQVAEKLSQGNLNERAGLEGPLEVSHLAHTLNVMAARLQNSLDSMRAFVANASHELRTPLTSIKLQVDALQNGACDEPEVAKRFLVQIENEIDRLSHSVNDMLDLSQIEGGAQPEIRPVSLNELASEVSAFWETRLRQAGITLNLAVDPVPLVVNGDPHQLRRLLDNLLDNAIKNTPPDGQVHIRVGACPVKAKAGAQAMVRVQVHDSGRGIAPQHLPYIFDRFYRIDSRPSAGRTGGGLGLAIARSIVLSHGGEISVESQVDAGTTFTIDLPVG